VRALTAVPPRRHGRWLRRRGRRWGWLCARRGEWVDPQDFAGLDDLLRPSERHADLLGRLGGVVLRRGGFAEAGAQFRALVGGCGPRLHLDGVPEVVEEGWGVVGTEHVLLLGEDRDGLPPGAGLLGGAGALVGAAAVASSDDGGGGRHGGDAGSSGQAAGHHAARRDRGALPAPC
jgi:hypothetical protein